MNIAGNLYSRAETSRRHNLAHVGNLNRSKARGGKGRWLTGNFHLTPFAYY